MNLIQLRIMLHNLISHRKLKRLFLKLIYILIILQLISLFKYYLSNYEQLIRKIKQKNLKSIQLLTGRFFFVNWKLGHELGEIPFRNCPEKRCYAYRSWLQRPSENADGIMVHGPNLWYMPNKKKYKRNPKQLWLYYSMEAQGRTHCSAHFDVTELDDWFNLTATYKRDSDVYVDYREFRSWNDLETNQKYIDQFDRLVASNSNPIRTITDLSQKNEDATVAWFVSHCGTQSRREEYVEEMQKYIKIDVFGACNKRRDPCSDAKDKDKCFIEFLNKYKFYLSFENSLCTDYVSEKYWEFFDSDKLFSINLIPIVRGAQSSYYKETSIVGSFIDAQEFKSAQDLANYLHYLNQNNTAYMEYFKWKIDLYKRMLENRNKINVVKETWNISTEYHLREPFCRLCSFLHNDTFMNSKTNKVWKMSEWFTKKTNCWDQIEPSYIFDKVIKFIGFCI